MPNENPSDNSDITESTAAPLAAKCSATSPPPALFSDSMPLHQLRPPRKKPPSRPRQPRRQRPMPSFPWLACAITNAAAPPVGTAPAATRTSSPSIPALLSRCSTSKVPASSPTSGSPSTHLIQCTSRTSYCARGGMVNPRLPSRPPSAISTASCSAITSSISPLCSSSRP